MCVMVIQMVCSSSLGHSRNQEFRVSEVALCIGPKHSMPKHDNDVMVMLYIWMMFVNSKRCVLTMNHLKDAIPHETDREHKCKHQAQFDNTVYTCKVGGAGPN